MTSTFARLPAIALLSMLMLGAACSLEATGMGPEDAAAGQLDPEDAGTPPPPPTAKPVERDAATDAQRPTPPPVDASQPDADVRDAEADAQVDAAVPEDAGPAVTRCGTRGGVRCVANAFCNFEPDPECGALDRGGVCEERPDSCRNVYTPVCGCDGVTYPNSCYAHAQGVSVRRAMQCGAAECEQAGGRVRPQLSCPRSRAQWEITVNGQLALCCVGGNPEPEPVTRVCGGLAGTACGAGQLCNYEVSAGGLGCGVPDATGVCEVRPTVCTQQYSPVCGCDRRTYGNACTAHANGVAVLREGTCERAPVRP